jgi:hypothetical protein
VVQPTLKTKTRKFMKLFKQITYFISIIFLLNACGKTELSTTENIFPTDKSLVKFFLLSPNTGSVMIKANDVKVNSLSSGSIGIFPGIINSSSEYAAIPPNSTISLALPFAGTGNDSIVVFKGSIISEANKNYSVTLADTGVDRTLFIVNDNAGGLPNDSTYSIRLINAMAKSPNLSLVRVDSTNATQVIRDTIIKDIAFKGASDYINVPLTAKINPASTTTPKSIHSFLRYRLILTSTGVSLAGTITPPQTVSSPGLNQRYISVYASGFATGTSSLVPTLQTTIVYNK